MFERETWQVRGRAEIAGVKAFLVHIDRSLGLDSHFEIWRNEDTGLWAYDRFARAFRLRWRYPTKPAETFPSIDVCSSQPASESLDPFTLLAWSAVTKDTASLVTVQAGTYGDCIFYQMDATYNTQVGPFPRRRELFFKPGFGMLKRVEYAPYAPGNPELSSVELSEYLQAEIPVPPAGDEELNANRLMPLRLGNLWEYEVSNAAGASTETWKVTGRVEVDGAKAYLLEIQQQGGTPVWEFWANNDSGVNVHNDSYRGLSMLWKYPTAVGDSFYSNRRQSYSAETKSTQVTVTVPAGKFEECIQYEMSYGFFSNTGYHLIKLSVIVKPGVGMVYSQSKHSSNQGPANMLEAYSLIRYEID